MSDSSYSPTRTLTSQRAVSSGRQLTATRKYAHNLLSCMGDSITYYDNFPSWQNINFAAYPFKTRDLIGGSCVELNLGVSGQSTSQILARISQMWMYGVPKVATIQGGLNDWGQGLGTATDCGNNFQSMVTALKNAGCSRIVICNIHSIYSPGTANGQLDPYRSAIQSVATASNLPFCDWYTQAGLVSGDYTDGMHLTPAGSQKLANVLKSTLDIAGWTQILHD